MMILAPMVSLGLDKDSTFFSVLQKFEEVGPYAQCFSQLDFTEERGMAMKETAMNAGYTSKETSRIIRSFLSDVYPMIRKEFLADLFEDVSEAELRDALAYYDSEQGRAVVQRLNYVRSDECANKLINLVIADLADMLVDKKVRKKKCDAPSKYRKLCLSYLVASGVGYSLVNMIFAKCADNERSSNMLGEMSDCIVTDLMQVCYPTVTMEDLRYFDKYSKTDVGSKLNACADLLPYGIDGFFDRLETEFESFLGDWMKKNPPAHWNVTPEETPVEDDDKGHI